MPSVAEKDAFPTPDMTNKEGEQVVWAGPGMTVLEYATVKIAAQIGGHQAVVMEDSTIADMAYNLAKAVCDRLDQGEDDPEET
jgi:hypothetical protein